MTTLSGRALGFLGVHPGEKRSAGLMLAHSFFMGCATVYFETAASATFLARFAPSYLPWVYVAAAGANTLTGTAYANVQRRISFARLMKGTLWFLLVTVLAVRLGFAASRTAWVAFAGMVSYRMISSLTDLEYWAVASRIYDVRQAKRLFGLVGAGEVVARIAGSFSIPFVVRVAGVSNLMVLSALGLALCLVAVSLVLGPVADVNETVLRSAREAPRGRLREIAAHPYLALVVGVAVLATFGKYFVDFAFLEQISTRPGGEVALAGFLGLFNGLTQTLSLLTRVFISRPLLARFGIRVGVLVLPVAHALCAAAAVIAGALGGGASLFWLMIANQGIYKTLKHPIDNASFKVLYQPLKPDQRLAAQIAVEIIFSPIVVGLSGAVMLLFTAVMPYNPARFSLVLLVTFVAWALAARVAGREYVVALLAMLRRRIEGNVTLPFEDATTLSFLRERSASESPAEACAALGLLEKAAAPDVVDVLVDRVRHPAPDVRRYALERLLAIAPEALERVRRRAVDDAEPSVRGAAMRALAAGARREALAQLLPYTRDEVPVVRRAAIASLLGLHDDDATAAAIASVRSLATSRRAVDRELAALVAGEHGLESVVPPLLSDREPRVRRAALGAAGKLRRPAQRHILIEHLASPRFADTAAAALALGGDAALAVLEPLFRPGAERAFLVRVVHVYALVGTEAARSALRARLAFPDAAVRGRVLEALDRLGAHAEGRDREVVLASLADEAREAARTLGIVRDLADAPDLDGVRRALEGELNETRRRVFHLLALVHDRVAVQRASAHLAHASKDKRAYALEVLDLVLSTKERAMLGPLLDDASPEARLTRLEAQFPQPHRSADACLVELIERPAASMGGWARAQAIYAAGTRLVGIAASPIAAVAPNDALVRETAPWALARLAGVPEEKGLRPMLLIEKVILLKSVPMFAKTSEGVLAEIAGFMEELDYERGATIVQKGDVGDSMYIVVSGSVRVFDGDTTLSILGDREIFGELALLDPEPRSASVAAVEDTRVFRLDGDTFSQLMAGNLEVVQGVLHVLCNRLRRTSASRVLRALALQPSPPVRRAFKQARHTQGDGAWLH